MNRRLLLTAALVLSACASHQKLGERAASTGDWKAAEREYAEALRGDPSNREAKARWESARGQALAAAISHGKACAAVQDWECAYAEGDYAARLEPGSTELAVFRRDAGRALGLLRVRRAEEALQRHEAAEGLQLVAAARGVTEDAAVRGEAQRVQAALVRDAVDRGDAFRRTGQLEQAIALYAVAAEADGSVRSRLDGARAELARARDAEASRREGEGDAMLQQRRFAEAQAAYEAAVRIRPSSRTSTLVRYAASMRAGEVAVQARDWPRATQAYQAAADLGIDARGVAVRELEAVRVRPLAIRLRLLLVRPAQPDGRPWVGERSRTFDAVMVGARAADRALESDAPRALRSAIEVANGVPAENVPALSVVAELGGRRFATPAQRGLYATPDAALVVHANELDDRILSLRVLQRDAGTARELGLVQVPLSDLVTRRQVVLRQAAIARLELLAEPADGAEGTVTGFATEAFAGGAQPAPPPKKR
jgi:tetratricopeptide (TPR) repeat protein